MIIYKSLNIKKKNRSKIKENDGEEKEPFRFAKKFAKVFVYTHFLLFYFIFSS